MQFLEMIYVYLVSVDKGLYGTGCRRSWARRQYPTSLSMYYVRIENNFLTSTYMVIKCYTLGIILLKEYKDSIFVRSLTMQGKKRGQLSMP